MLKVGLTGGIGSGKSTVARVFETIGVPVYYSDLRAKQIMVDNQDVKSKIIDLLGKEAYQNTELNKVYIASKIFTDSVLLSSLNKIVHPAVRVDFLEWTASQIAPFVIHEAAILFESKANQYMDCSIMVFAPIEVRIARVIERDRLTKAEVDNRVANQMNDEEKMKLADFVINNYSDNLLVPQVVDIYNKLCAK